MKALKENLLGVFTAILYGINLIFIPTLLIVGGLISWLIPLKRFRHGMSVLLQWLSVQWFQLNNEIMKLHARGKIDIQGSGELSPERSYLLISNHRTWIDVILIGQAFNKKAPFFKFFLKKELLWSLPFAGLACKAVGYAFMKRHTVSEIRKNPQLRYADIKTAKKACQVFRETPSTIVNFPEGTRFNVDKQALRESPYQHLLRPKSGGGGIVVNELHDYLKGILNITLYYKKRTPSFWEYCCGKFDKLVVRYEVLPLTADLMGDFDKDRTYRAHFQNWLNELWDKKDQKIDEIVREHS